MPELIFQGIAASPGIAIGKALVMPRPQHNINFRSLTDEKQVREETQRLKNAMAAAREELLHIREDMQNELAEYTGIMDAHILILEDKLLKHKSVEYIEQQKICSEWALSLCLDNATQRFQGIQDEYIRDRLQDVSVVIDHVMRHLSGGQEQPLQLNDKVILVVHDLSPADISRLDINTTMGLVIEQGGSTSHTAILARAMSIPAVVGLDKATSLISNGNMAIVDGSKGEFIVRPGFHTQKAYEDRSLAYELYLQEILALADQPAQTVDGLRVEVGANIELLEEVASVHNFGAECVGLYRTEFACLSYSRLPSEEELYSNFVSLVWSLKGMPVSIRTLDVGGDKLAGFSPTIKELNPNLGLRGIRYSLKEKDFFLNQLKAILRASLAGPVQIMFPLVSSMEELQAAFDCLEEAKQQLTQRGDSFADNIPVGIMIEVPSAVVIADLLAQHVDFFSIGTNDLIQYTMAVDRDNEQVANLYQPLNPAILRFIHHIAQAGKKGGIPVSMCGEMAGDPKLIPLLLGLGVERFSMSPLVMPRIKEVVRMVDVGQWQKLGKKAMRLNTAQEIEELLDRNLQKHMPQLLM